MSLLDSIIDSQSGPKIVGEEHNPANIQIGTTFDANLASQIDGIMNRGWDEREYGISREAAVARLKTSDTPEKRAAWLKDMKERALKRASLNVSNGRVNMFAAGKLPWHGLGVLVDKATTSAEAIRLAGMDWEVLKKSLGYMWEDANFKGTKVVNDAFALVRADTGAALGTVGSRYQPIQNREAFNFLDGVLEQFGAKYETAGVLYNGEKVWILAHMPKQRFTINGGDDVEPYVLFTNPHDGSGVASCYPTSVRVVCANTLRVSRKDHDKGLKIRHTGNVKDKMRRAQETLGLAVKNFQSFKEAAETMYHKPCEVKGYVHGVLDVVLDVTQAQATMGADVLATALKVTEANRELEVKRLQKQIDRRENILTEILERYESERNGIGNIRGTAWASFNAVTEYADHHKPGRQAADANVARSRRFESVIAGEADTLKQVAFERALAV